MVKIVHVILVLLISSPFAAAAVDEEPSRVLILFSNDRLLPANQHFDEGIRETLDPQGTQTSVSFFGEFLDATRIAGPEREDALEDYLRRRYENLPPHVLVALGPEALQFLSSRRESLFPDIPLVFGGINKDRLDSDTELTDIAGLPMVLNVSPVVESLLSMRPETREILLVHGAAEGDRLFRDIAMQQCSHLADRVKFTDFPVLPVDELKSHLAELSSDQAVLYLTYFQDPEGTTYIPARVAREISESSAVPVIGPYDTYIGTGVLGVRVSTFKDEGIELGKLIRRVLDGEKPENIGILPPSPTRLILDDRQVKKWKLRNVPAEAERRYETLTLWEEHPAQVAAVVAVVILQGLLISWLLLARAKRNQAEKELRFSEERFSGVFRGSPAAICIVRKADGRILDVNPEWEQVTRVSRDEAVGRTPLETGMIIGSNAETRYRMFLESGKPLHDFEQLQRTPDGGTRYLSLSSELVTLQEEPCYILVAKDVTGSRLEEEARQQLAHSSRLAMLGEMTASIAHEVNQPLGAILSNADAAEMLMERSEPPLDEIRSILSDIRRDDMRASTVIQRVRAMIGNREVEQIFVDVNDLILEALRQITREADRRGVTLEHELDSALPPVHGDPIQIGQVLLNLLINGMDAMNDTPVASRLLIVRSSRLNDDTVRVSVEDRGHGVPPDKLGRVFDSFFTTKEGGMGLGLALARSIAEAHGGEISVENNSSAGAVFHLILPGAQES